MHMHPLVSLLVTSLQQCLSNPPVLSVALVILVIYRQLSQKSKLPKIPAGFLILYLLLRLLWILFGRFPFIEVWAKWPLIGANIALAWGILNILFNWVVNQFWQQPGKLPIPRITRDFILAFGYAFLTLIFLRVQGDVNLTSLITTSAVLTAIVGLAAQSTLTSFFAGLILQIDRPFQIRDWITVGDYTGEVCGINWKSTQLITHEEEMIFIPNVEIIKSNFRNYSRPTPNHLARFNLGIDYDAPPNKVREVILQVLREHQEILQTPPSEIRLTAFGEFAINYEVRFWTGNYGNEPRLKSEINNKLWYKLRRYGIQIPLPTRNIRLNHLEKSRKERRADRTRDQIARRLEAIPLFAPLAPNERNQLADEVTRLVYGHGEPIVRQGEAGNSLYLIEQGRCEILIADGPETRCVGHLHAGDLFGEMSLLTGEPRNATVRSVGDSVVFSLSSEAFRTILIANPTICQDLANILAQRQEARLAESGEPRPVSNPAGSLVDRIKAFFGIG